MSVKTIFKVLLGTIVIMVLSSIVIEIMNISITALQLTQISKLACRQSAVLFSQETYKERSDGAVTGGSTSMSAVTNTDGGLYIDGNFYGYALTAEQIYTNIYSSNSFKSWVSSAEVLKGNWKSINLINRAINDPSSLNVSLPTDVNDPNYDALVDDYTDAMLAKSYKNVMMTPLNMGVPYMDKGVLEKIFKWNLAQLTSDCSSSLIRKDDNGDYCVFYKGFRVYADQATITNIEYRVYDLNDSSEKSEFERITHIDTDKLGFDDSLIQYLGGYDNDDERKRVCVVGLEFSVPVAYEGVTPIKSIMNYVWNQSVEGLDGNQSNSNTKTWNDSTANLVSGGFGDNVLPYGVLPVPGKLTYYVVR